MGFLHTGRLQEEKEQGRNNMLLVCTGSDIDFLDITYNIEGECHRMNIPTRFYPDRRLLLAGNTTIIYNQSENLSKTWKADYIGDNYLTILELIRKDNGK